MMDLAVVRLAAALSDGTGRREASQRLAEALGAEAALVLVQDADAGVLLPAPGFPGTLPGGQAWREFLRAIPDTGTHSGSVGFPTPSRSIEATALAGAGAALVFIGVRLRDEDIAALAAVMPLIASTVRAEHIALGARGERSAARAYAREAESLARALDSARSEVERALHQLEAQTRALHAARTEAEEATRAKDEFLAMLGHELRNPLSPIRTALQLMRLKKQTSPELEVIERQVADLVRLVDDLLDVSRITRGKIELRKRDVEIAEVVARAVETASPALESRQQRLSVAVPAGGLVLHADPARVAQVISNLLNNASKYSDDGSAISLTAEKNEGKAVLCVRDEGIGISPDMLERVFELFEQHPQSLDRAAGGLGLGLAIVRSLVGMHGGRVWASSVGDGRGSEFWLELPLAPEAEAGVARTPTAPRSRADALPRARGERVLIVDDNNDAAELLHEALTSIGYDVRSAADGPTALAVAEEFAPEIGVLDIGLPVMDGYELARRLRARSKIRLVAVTGYGQPSDRAQSRAAGFDAHLVKPIALEELADLLTQLCAPPVSDPLAP